MEWVRCDRCNGAGKIVPDDFMLGNGLWVRGRGYIPCPKCNGTKVVMRC